LPSKFLGGSQTMASSERTLLFDVDALLGEKSPIPSPATSTQDPQIIKMSPDETLWQ
jgi:hypothetical protein